MYPAARHAVVNGTVVNEVIHSKEEEREGWLPSPHTFRPLTVAEFVSEGYSVQDANALHQQDLKRVEALFANSCGEGAPQAVLATDGEAESLKEDNANLAQKLDAAIKEVADKQATIDLMTEKFEKNWKSLESDRDRLKAENVQLKAFLKAAKKAAKAGDVEPEEAEAGKAE